MLLTKSLFRIGRQCPLRLWREAHEPDAPELTPAASDRTRLVMGQTVGRAAEALLPGAVRIPPAWAGPAARAQATADAIAGGATALYEATVVADGLAASLDLLERAAEGWVLREVKARKTPKAKADLAALVEEVAFERLVTERAGLPVARAELVVLNRAHRHPGPEPLFAALDLTGPTADAQPAVAAAAAEQLNTLHGSAPATPVGPHCFTPDACPFLTRCWGEFPPHHVSETYYANAKVWIPWLAEGWTRIPDVPDPVLATLRKPVALLRQKPAIVADRLVVADGLAAALAPFDVPLAWLDFETVMPALPRWPGTAPLEQLPVQFSAITVDGAVVDFLADGPEDCRAALAEQLVAACAGAERVVAYYATFERGCLERLAEAVPAHADALLAIADRLIDLLPPVQEHVYHPDFRGSFSLKAVLPVLVPELSYQGLLVADGDTASTRLLELLFEPERFTDAERARWREALLTYCRLDVQAMVRLLEVLRTL